jgi:hypothetical protein
MISGLVLKYLNGECFVIWRGYETTLLASTEFNLTVPPMVVWGSYRKYPYLDFFVTLQREKCFV